MGKLSGHLGVLVAIGLTIMKGQVSRYIITLEI
jgi:hypothetical protein